MSRAQWRRNQIRGASAVATVLVSLALAGCSGSPASAPTGSSDASTPSASTADLRPWASAIAKQSAALDTAQQELSDSECSAATSNDVTCSAQLTAAAFQMQTIQTEIDALSTPKAQSYIGEVPDEIASLYSDTQASAAAAAADGQAWLDGDCTGSDSMDCLHLAGGLTNSMESLGGQFTAWTPYS